MEKSGLSKLIDHFVLSIPGQCRVLKFYFPKPVTVTSLPSASLSRQPIYATDSKAIVRAWDCHCPFKQIDHRPASRSIEQSAQGNGRKMRRQMRWKNSRVRNFPSSQCLIMGPWPRIVNLSPWLANLVHAWINSDEQNVFPIDLQNIALCIEGGKFRCTKSRIDFSTISVFSRRR